MAATEHEAQPDVYITSMSPRTPAQREVIIRDGSQPIQVTSFDGDFMTSGYDDPTAFPRRQVSPSAELRMAS